MTLTVGSLFSGYGGLELGVGAAIGPHRVIWQAEVDPNPSLVLDARWPEAPNLGDVENIDWAELEPPDVIVGGFPCQDISHAGLRAGIEGERSGLWSEFAEAVRVLRPSLVVVENVAALLVRGVGTVLGDLAEVGYDSRWGCFRASDAGAPHARERIFLVAWPAGHAPRLDGEGFHAGGGTPADADLERAGRYGRTVPGAAGAVAAGAEPDLRAAGHEGEEALPDADSLGSRRRELAGRGEEVGEAGDEPPRGGPDPSWGEYGPAVRRWELIVGRPAPAAVNAQGYLSQFFVEWMMGLEFGWVTEHVRRTPALRMLGNGVVPQQATLAVRTLLERESARAAA